MLMFSFVQKTVRWPNRSLPKILTDTSIARKNVGGEIIKTSIFSENFESGLGSWSTTYSTESPTFTPRNWMINSSAPAGHAGSVAYGIDPPGGNCGDLLETGRIMLISPVITLPPAEPGIHWLAFDHYFDFEQGLDGGILWYKLNNGNWRPLDSETFSTNGYNYNPTEEVNPFDGWSYFSGAVPNWRRSLVNLRTASIAANNNVQFAWVVGTDGCGGSDGWYIDNIEVYHEQEIPVEPQVEFEVAKDSVSEGAADMAGSTFPCLKYADHKVKVKINKPASSSVTVNISVLPTQLSDEDPGYDPNYDPTLYATQGAQADFTLSTTKVIFAPGETSKEISIYVNDDTAPEKDEILKLGFTIITSSDAQIGAQKVYTFKIIDDDKGEHPIITDILRESFDGGSIPATWTVVGTRWGFGDGEDPYFDNALWYTGSTSGQEQSVSTPAFDATNSSLITLSFKQLFIIGSSPKGLIDVWTGSEWQNLVTQSTRVVGQDGRYNAFVSTSVNIPVAYASSAMKLRFSVKGGNSASWVIDDIAITGTNFASEIQTEASIVPDEKRLGPNATIYFYDPESKAILAKIKNLTSHDYGCTSVEIDRAGDGTIEWLNGYSITNKTLRVIPSNPDPNGKYEITLYYTASELGGFSGSIATMGKSENGIGVDNSSESVVVPVQISKYNNDYAFTATFDTGFSGFGLSNAPPGTSLPVRLSKFEGEHSREGNILRWETTEEVNNEYFSVERSINGKEFTEIGRREAIKVLSHVNQYSFTDFNCMPGNSYYRLKQVDLNGQYAYSHTIVIYAEKSINLYAFPNPSKGMARFKVAYTGGGYASLEVINSSGKMVLKAIDVPIENGEISYDFDKLLPGLYNVIGTVGTSIHTYKLLKE